MTKPLSPRAPRLWIERLVQQTNQRGKSLGRSPKANPEQPQEGGLRARHLPIVSSIWAERVLPSNITGRPRPAERVASQTVGLAALALDPSPLPPKPTECSRSAERVASQAMDFAACAQDPSPLPSKTSGRPCSAERAASQAMDLAGFAPDPSPMPSSLRTTSEKTGGSDLHATQLRSGWLHSSSSGLPDSGLEGRLFYTDVLPGAPLLSDPTRTRMMATRESSTRFFSRALSTRWHTEFQC